MVDRTTQCWIISVPVAPSDHSALNVLRTSVEKIKGCSVTKFHLPILKAGAFDTLVKAAVEEIPKLDTECEALLGKVGVNLASVLEKPELGPDDVKVAKTNLKGYLLTFIWDEMKYPSSQNLNTIISLIMKQAKQIDSIRESQMRKYMITLEQLNSYEKKKVGPLTTRHYLGDLVSCEDFIAGSTFLKTYLAIVPRTSKETWLSNYEWLHEEVVPQSAKFISEEADYALYTVVAFIRCEKKLRENARKLGFYIRDYELHDIDMEEYDYEMEMLQIDKEKQKAPLIKLLMKNFSDVYVAYCHLKAIRLHIESLLRYGPNNHYEAAIIFLDESQVKKVRAILQTLYSGLEKAQSRSKRKKSVNADEVMESGEYYPYVYSSLKISLDELVKK